jgi:hypothetical protein
MLRRAQFGVIAATLVIAVGSPVMAHHSAAAYDLTKSLTLNATVASVVFTNPHVMLNFDVKTDRRDSALGDRNQQSLGDEASRLDERHIEGGRRGDGHLSPGDQRRDHRIHPE